MLFFSTTDWNQYTHKLTSVQKLFLKKLQNTENCLLIFDDSCKKIFNDKEFVKLATAEQHKNINVICMKHNLYQQSK